LLAEGLPPAVRAGTADTVPTTSVEGSDFVPLLTRFVETRLQAGSTEVHDEVLALVERTLFLQTLRHTGGNQSKAAHILGTTRKTLRAKLAALGIAVGQTTSIEEAGNLAPFCRA
jgi:two-component system nitrogen regulation response regulator GlnG